MLGSCLLFIGSIKLIQLSSNTLFELVSDERTIKLVPSLADKSSHPLVKGTFTDKMAELGIFNEDLFGDDNFDQPFNEGFLDN